MQNSIGVTGHQNIPQEGYTYIKSEIEKILDKNKIDISLSSLAAGADQLFAETSLNKGIRLYSIIPCKDYELTFKDDVSKRSFFSLKERSHLVEILDYDQPSELAFLQAGKRVAELSNKVVAIWDGKRSKGKGGTADIVEYAKKLNKEVIIIWPQGLIR
ncbi:hypothetical protein [Rufibacter soli]